MDLVVVVDVRSFVAAVERLTQYVGQCKPGGSCHVKIGKCKREPAGTLHASF
jgi:hypothetical protein